MSSTLHLARAVGSGTTSPRWVFSPAFGGFVIGYVQLDVRGDFNGGVTGANGQPVVLGTDRCGGFELS